MGKMRTLTRQIANKLWISDVTTSNYVKQEGWNPNYVELDSKKVSRVNVVATVVSKFVSEDGNFGSLTLDDGTDTIRVKGFGPDVPKIADTNIGAIVRFIGKVKEYNEEIYFSPEIIRELEDPNWIIVRKLELPEPKEIPKDEETSEKLKEEPKKEVEEKKEISKEESNPKKEKEKEVPKKGKKEDSKDKKEIKDEDTEEVDMNSNIIDTIKELDEGDGADMKKVLSKSGLDSDEGKKFLFGLLKRGEVYEPKKGKLKVLD